MVQNMDEQIEPQVHTSNMDTDQLDQLLDEFEDVFVKTGEDSNRLNIESMMDKMANGTLSFLSNLVRSSDFRRKR